MASGRRGYLNNFATQLNGSITAIATSITIDDTSGTINTALATYDYVALTIDDGTDVEIVHCTADSSGTLTIERGKEGTSGTAFADNTPVECRPTRDSFAFEFLSDVDFSGGAPSTDDQLKFNSSGILVPYTPSGGGGEFSLVSSNTLGSASASVTFDISTQATYKIVLDRCVHNSTADLILTVAYDSGGTTYGTSNYKYTNRLSNANTAGYTHDRSTSATSIKVISGLSADADRTFEGEIILYQKDATTHFIAEWNCTNILGFDHVQKQVGSGTWRDTSNTLVEAKLEVTGGTITAGSTFHLLRRNY